MNTAQQRLDKSRYVAYLHYTRTGAIFSENFSSIRSVFVSTRAQQEQKEDGTNMPYESQNPSGVSKSTK